MSSIASQVPLLSLLRADRCAARHRSTNRTFVTYKAFEDWWRFGFRGDESGSKTLRDMLRVGCGTPQHGLSSKKMALITSDYDIMRSLSIKWP